MFNDGKQTVSQSSLFHILITLPLHKSDVGKISHSFIKFSGMTSLFFPFRVFKKRAEVNCGQSMYNLKGVLRPKK